MLQLEFARQGEMEQRVGLETTLFGGPPELGNLTKLANSQIGFMNIFAYPLFEAVADILPSMTFAGEEIKANQEVWKQKIEEEKSKGEERLEAERYSREGFQSPRSGSPERFFESSPEHSHPEGLPASGPQPEDPHSIPLSTSQGTLDTPQSASLPDISNTDTKAPSFTAFSHKEPLAHQAPGSSSAVPNTNVSRANTIH